jgi:hypothetical protein
MLQLKGKKMKMFPFISCFKTLQTIKKCDAMVITGMSQLEVLKFSILNLIGKVFAVEMRKVWNMFCRTA